MQLCEELDISLKYGGTIIEVTNDTDQVFGYFGLQIYGQGISNFTGKSNYLDSNDSELINIGNDEIDDISKVLTIIIRSRQGPFCKYQPVQLEGEWHFQSLD